MILSAKTVGFDVATVRIRASVPQDRKARLWNLRRSEITVFEDTLCRESFSVQLNRLWQFSGSRSQKPHLGYSAIASRSNARAPHPGSSARPAGECVFDTLNDSFARVGQRASKIEKDVRNRVRNLSSNAPVRGSAERIAPGY